MSVKRTIVGAALTSLLALGNPIALADEQQPELCADTSECQEKIDKFGGIGKLGKEVSEFLEYQRGFNNDLKEKLDRVIQLLTAMRDAT